MYLKLGKTKINYSTPKIDDFTILAQVTSSDLSYEKPVLVRTAEELKIWFGSEYKERAYYEELLKGGVVLYLTKKISSNVSRTNDYIDYSKWDRVGVYLSIFHNYTEGFVYIVDNKEYIIKDNNLEVVDNEVLKLPVYNGFESLPEKGEEKKLYVMIDSSYWIWLNDFGWVNTDNLPQNTEDFRSVSKNNRDTLLIYKDWAYSTPEFINKCPENLNISLEGLDYERIKEGYQTLGFTVDLGNGEEPGEDDYIIVPNKEGKGVLIYFINEPKELSKYYPGGSVSVSLSAWKEGLRNTLEDLGYIIDNGVLYCSKPTETTYFYKMSNGFQLTPSYKVTHNIIDKYKGEKPILKFWSKTIGSGGNDGNIKISISPEYIEIERFGYLEVFEIEEGVDVLSEISNKSKLVYCEGELISSPIEKKNYEMRGSLVETGTSYKKSLEVLIGEGDTKPDFILIDSLEDIEINSPEDTYWETLLNYSKLCDCQFLIQNTKEDYINNYINDKDNRLVYFFNEMYVSGQLRPAYYAFLFGILSDNYSISMESLNYISPIKDSNKDIDNGGLTIYEKDLKLHKSNYLIDNGLYYYYKLYQEGEEYNTSILMRFILGKVSRQISKNRWDIISDGRQGRIESVILGLLSRIKNSYSIVRDLKLANFSVEGEKLNLSIETKISDLVKNNVSLDIEINYNKLN